MMHATIMHDACVKCLFMARVTLNVSCNNSSELYKEMYRRALCLQATHMTTRTMASTRAH